MWSEIGLVCFVLTVWLGGYITGFLVGVWVDRE